MLQYALEAHGVLTLQLYDRAACAEMVKHVRGPRGWESAQVRDWDGPGAYAIRTRPEFRRASVLTSPRASGVLEGFDDRMERVIKPLIREVWGATLDEHSGTHIVRYEPGDRFLAHSDVAPDTPYRYFTVICYLNDRFEGGATSFPSLDYAATPRSGKAIIFPSQYLHSAEPVVRGLKYVIVSWVTGPLPLNWFSPWEGPQQRVT